MVFKLWIRESEIFREVRTGVQDKMRITVEPRPCVYIGNLRISRYFSFSSVKDFINRLETLDSNFISKFSAAQIIQHRSQIANRRYKKEVETTNEFTNLIEPKDSPTDAYHKNTLRIYSLKYASFEKQYGISPKLAMRLYNAAMYAAFVKPVPDEIRRDILITKGNFSRFRVQKYYTNKENIDQAYKDGNRNIVPILLESGLDIASLKDYFGKGTWKQLANNTWHRNKCIGEFLHRVFEKYGGMRSYLHNHYDYNHSRINFQEVIETDTKVRYVIRLPTSLIRDTPIPVLNFILLHMKGKWSKAIYNRDDAQFFSELMDTHFILGNNYNLAWSRRRIEEEHNKIVNQRKREQHEHKQEYATVFQHYESCLKDYTNLELGYKATLLKTMQEVVEEGVEMGHCVGGYAKYAYKGTYLVYSVVPIGEGERFTIGIVRTKNIARRSAMIQNFGIEDAQFLVHDRTPKDRVDIQDYVLDFQQAYRKFNQPITCDKAKKFITELMILAQDRESAATNLAANNRESYA